MLQERFVKGRIWTKSPCSFKCWEEEKVVQARRHVIIRKEASKRSCAKVGKERRNVGTFRLEETVVTSRNVVNEESLVEDSIVFKSTRLT